MKFIRLQLCYLLNLALCLSPKSSTAWGPEGHDIVVRLAMEFLKPEVKQNVLVILGDLPVDSAATWMDAMRSNADFDFMKPWHYIDFSKEQQYQPSTEENIVNRIIITFNELRHKNVLCKEQVRMDLLILLHLLGDLHQPLHTGYDDDLGGNRVAVQYDTFKTNLHHFWDEDLLRLNVITFQSCFDFYNQHSTTSIDTIDGIHPALWMKESRTLLPFVYDYPGFIIPATYIQKAKPVLVRQLVVAGIRLAAILNKIFVSTAPILNMKEVASKFPDGIEAKDAALSIGKQVTACGRVYGVKTTDKVTFINVGDKYPKSPLTIVIFAKDYKNFQLPIDEHYADKNICIHGMVVEYQGKAEIIVTKPEDILLQ